ncbi:MAG: hypothetical protein BWX83_00851 [Candidatus Cloacimonetes bacterium ADurb.Bin117]|nr:MAG: hypothetical protein BWX83_00851 [Candidatus Cloacimonetes bacterium ADurb.Bin117]
MGRLGNINTGGWVRAYAIRGDNNIVRIENLIPVLIGPAAGSEDSGDNVAGIGAESVSCRTSAGGKGDVVQNDDSVHQDIQFTIVPAITIAVVKFHGVGAGFRSSKGFGRNSPASYLLIEPDDEGLLRVGGAGIPVSGKGSASAIKLDFLDGIGNVNEVVGDLIVDIIGSVQGTGVQVSDIAETGLGVNFRVLSRHAEGKCRQYHGEKKNFLHL